MHIDGNTKRPLLSSDHIVTYLIHILVCDFFVYPTMWIEKSVSMSEDNVNLSLGSEREGEEWYLVLACVPELWLQARAPHNP